MLTVTSFPRARTAASDHVVLLCVAWAVILLLFVRDALALVGIWWSSSTFTHCLLIPPIIAWLVAQRWPELRLLKPRGWLPGLVLVGVGAVGWLLGEAAGVALARHLGLVLMLQGAVVTLLGPEVSRGLMFPLAYMLFLVPAGEGLVPPLQTLTAQICMALLALSGIPAHIDGVFITIPNGWFEVAEACSGVKFLVAMAAYGALVANVCFRSWARRIAFMTAALVLPVLANGVRAWGTIYMAHRTNAHFAEGFDHVIYGWVFFGIVIAVLIFSSSLTISSRGGSPELASTVAASVVMIVGVWVLSCLARPIRPWKVMLIVGVSAVFAGLIAVLFTRAFLSLAVAFPELLWVPAFAAVGIAFVEFLWRRDQRVRALDPRTVAGE